MQQQHRVQPGSVLDERGPHLIAGCIMLDQPVAGRGGLTVALDGDAPVPRLVDQLELGLEKVHVQPQRSVKVRHGLPGDLSRVTIMTDETAYHGTILLLDPGLVVATIRARPGELDAMVGTVLDQRFVDERAVVTRSAFIRVDTTDGERQPLSDGFQSRHDQGLLPGQQGYGFGPAGADVGSQQAVDE